MKSHFEIAGEAEEAIARLLCSSDPSTRAAGRLNATDVVRIFQECLKAEVERPNYDPMDLILASTITCAAMITTVIMAFAKEPRNERDAEELVQQFSLLVDDYIKRYLRSAIAWRREPEMAKVNGE